MTQEKRIHQRNDVRLGLFCESFGGTVRKFANGTTVNASTGGMLFESRSNHFNCGDIVTISLFVPPGQGPAASGGTITGIARVIRTVTLPPQTNLPSLKPANSHATAIHWLRQPRPPGQKHFSPASSAAGSVFRPGP